MAANNLEEILLTGVKFYASKSKAEALALATQQDNPEPGSICFVSDNTGNYIILDGKIFGDGTTGSGGGGGAVVVTLSSIPVIEANGQVLKTLQDYFTNDGTVISDGFKVLTTVPGYDGLPQTQEVVVINDQGITIKGSKVITQSDLDTVLENLDVSGSVSGLINQAEQNAKDYADSLIASVYRIKGSVPTFSSLPNNAEIGDVYNVVQASGTMGTDSYVPAGTNYVKTENGWDALGGVLDLSAYKTAANTTFEIEQAFNAAKAYSDTKTSDLSDRITTNYNNISNLQTNIQTLSTTVSNNTTNIQNNTTNITNIATQLTWQ